MAYGQFGEEANLNIPEEIETLRSTIQVVGNRLVMPSAEDRIKSSRVKESQDDHDDEHLDPPSCHVGNIEMKHAGSIDGTRAEIFEDEDEPYSTSSRQAPASTGGTKSIKFVGVHSSSGSLQVNLLNVTLKKDNSEENLRDDFDRNCCSKACKKPSVGSKFSFANRTPYKEDLKTFVDDSRGKEGADMEEQTERRVSRRKMYRASRIGTPLLKGDYEEVGKPSLEEDKITELQDGRDELEDDQGLPVGHVRASLGEEQKSQDISSHKMQRRARKNAPRLKSSPAEEGTPSLLQKGKNVELQEVGLAMSSFDVLAGEFLKASIVLETAEVGGVGARLM